jgi:osmoprotectant transport system substrate-binding protein
MKKTTAASLVTVLAVSALALSACATTSTSTPAEGASAELAGLTGEIGSKDFSEQYILAHITSQLLNHYGADTTANTSVVGSANVRAALEGDDFLGYWEYTGTSWITYNGNTAPVIGEAEQFAATKEADAANGIAWLDPAPFNNTYAFAIRDDKAKELGVTSLSDIASLPVEEQTFCIESEFSTRDDGWPGLKTTCLTRTLRSSTLESSTRRLQTATCATLVRCSQRTAASVHSA